MWIFNEKIAFQHLPRTGGSYTTKTFKAIEGVSFVKLVTNHTPATVLIDRHGSQYLNAMYKFGFVRNPWSWQVSHFVHQKLGVDNRIDAEAFNEYVAAGEFVSFQDMYEKIHCVDGELWLDEVFRTEQLIESVNKVLEKFNLGASPFAGRKDNIRLLGRIDYRDYYNDESRILVRDRNSRIIDEYGYA